MPRLIYNTDEIESTGTHTVNESGYVYVGRKNTNKEVVWIILKK